MLFQIPAYNKIVYCNPSSRSRCGMFRRAVQLVVNTRTKAMLREIRRDRARISYFDAHCHLQLDPLWEHRDQVINKAKSASIVGICVAATTPGEDFLRVEELYLENKDFVTPCFGLHPYWIHGYFNTTVELKHVSVRNEAKSDLVNEHEDGAIKKLITELTYMLEKHPRAGVGECGLDKRITINKKSSLTAAPVSLDFQKRIFIAHLDIAIQYNRFIVCHCVGSWGALYETILSKYREVRRSDAALLWPPVILHSCNGISIDMAQLFTANIEHIFFSFSAGHISPKLCELIQCIPREQILIETDSPDQSMNTGALSSIAHCLGEGRGGVEYISSLSTESRSSCFDSDAEPSCCCSGDLTETNGKDCEVLNTDDTFDDFEVDSNCEESRSNSLMKDDSKERCINEPAAVVSLCEVLSQFLNMSHEEFSQLTTTNSLRIMRN